MEKDKLPQAPTFVSRCRISSVTLSQDFPPTPGGKQGRRCVLPSTCHLARRVGVAELLSAEKEGAASMRERNSLPAREGVARPWRNDSGADIFFVICLPYHWWQDPRTQLRRITREAMFIWKQLLLSKHSRPHRLCFGWEMQLASLVV